MTPTMHDDLEAQLHELFERQADAMHVKTRAWDDAPMATVEVLAPRRRTRSVLASLVATAAAALVIGLVAVAPGGNGVVVGGQPGVPTALSFTTKQVRFSTDGMTLVAGGRTFTAGGSTVDVNSDPGTRNKYTTLELQWNERGVQMRLYMYFTSDGHNWWANEIRTYNGKADGDWIEYQGVYFRTPLGHAFSGTVDLSATGGPGRLRFENLQLQAFLPIAACVHPAAPYAVYLGYDHADMPDDPLSGYGVGNPVLLDTSTCAQVTDPHAFRIDLSFTTPGIAFINTSKNGHKDSVTDFANNDQGIDLGPKAAGSTVLQVTARRRSTGAVVATVDIPVKVG